MFWMLTRDSFLLRGRGGWTGPRPGTRRGDRPGSHPSGGSRLIQRPGRPPSAVGPAAARAWTGPTGPPRRRGNPVGLFQAVPAAADVLRGPNLPRGFPSPLKGPPRRSRDPDGVLRRIRVPSERLLTPPRCHLLPRLRRPPRRSGDPDIRIPGHQRPVQNSVPAPRPWTLPLPPPPTLPRHLLLLLQALIPGRSSGLPNPNLLFLPSPESPQNSGPGSVRWSPPRRPDRRPPPSRRQRRRDPNLPPRGPEGRSLHQLTSLVQSGARTG